MPGSATPSRSMRWRGVQRLATPCHHSITALDPLRLARISGIIPDFLEITERRHAAKAGTARHCAAVAR